MDMKPTTGILGCALAAGLVTFAADNAQANDVINNVVYAPVKLKLTAQYQDGNKIKKMSITAKDVLKDLGYNNNVKLTAASDTGDIWVVNKDSLMEDLSSAGILYVTTDYDVSTVKGKGTKYAGIAYVTYNQGGTVPSVSSVQSLVANNYFEISGLYSADVNEGNVNNKGDYKFKGSFTSKDLSGYGYFTDLSASEVPVTGSASAKGSGKLQAPL